MVAEASGVRCGDFVAQRCQSRGQCHFTASAYLVIDIHIAAIGTHLGCIEGDAGGFERVSTLRSDCHPNVVVGRLCPHAGRGCKGCEVRVVGHGFQFSIGI